MRYEGRTLTVGLVPYTNYVTLHYITLTLEETPESLPSLSLHAWKLRKGTRAQGESPHQTLTTLAPWSQTSSLRNCGEKIYIKSSSLWYFVVWYFRISIRQWVSSGVQWHRGGVGVRAEVKKKNGVLLSTRFVYNLSYLNGVVNIYCTVFLLTALFATEPKNVTARIPI